MTDITKPPTATIELVGSYTARHVESGTTVDLTTRRNRSTTKSPLPVLCRELVAHGLDPATRVHVIRKALDSEGFIPVFKRDRRLSIWAGLDAVENERTPPRIVKYKPFPSDAVRPDFEREMPQATSGPADGIPREISVNLLPGNSDA